MSVELRRAGDRGWLIELPDEGSAPRVAAALADLGLDEVVPGHRTVLVIGAAGPGELSRVVEAALVGRAKQREPATIEIAVAYDGPDLDEVAGLTGLSPEEVVARHAAATYTVAFLGFAPGFGYLVGLDPQLVVPRRAKPRERVPAGSVAIAGPYSGVYPRETPGGWRLLGRTDATLFDPLRAPPALLAAGDHIRFKAP